MIIDGIILTSQAFFLVFLPFAWVYVFFGKKLSADLQARIGPKRVGFHGGFQPFADLIKLLGKQGTYVARREYLKRSALLCLAVSVLLSSMASIPFFYISELSQVDLILFWPVLSFLVAPLIIFLASQVSEVEFLSGFRFLLQSFVSLVPMLVGLIAIGLGVGGFSWEKITASQTLNPFTWIVFSAPGMPLVFAGFLIAGVTATGQGPMSSFLGGSQFWSGLSSRFSGVELLVFSSLQILSRFLICAYLICLFFGGGNIEGPEWIHYVLVGVKSVLIGLVVLLFEKTNSRVRSDHATALVWKIATPLSFLGLFINLVWMGFKG